MTNSPLHREILLENYKNPINNFKPEVYTHKHKLDNSSCGDEITVYVEIDDSGTELKKVHYEIRACALSVASASLLSEELKGVKIAELNRWSKEEVEKVIGTKLSTARIKCGMLPLEAIKQAIGLIEKSEVL
jgi:nitrogen fixation NifU-like protein